MKKINKFFTIALVIFTVSLFISCDNGSGTTHTHTPGAAATCTEAQTCTSCGAVLQNKLAHTPGAAATCTEAQTCTVCNNTLAAKLGHTGLTIIPATCTEPGNTGTGTCTRAGCVVPGDVIPALGHDWNWTTHTIGSGIRACQRNGDCSATAGIGDIGPGGGVIFYVAPGNFSVSASPYGTPSGKAWALYYAYYLEAAPASWDGGTTDPALEWALNGSAGYTTLVSTGVAIGVGRANTMYIHLTDATAPAATACSDYRGGGFTDWFLPNDAELNRLYVNKTAVNNANGGLSTAFPYWSSLQDKDNNNRAYGQWFDISGNPESFLKSASCLVRPVRAF